MVAKDFSLSQEGLANGQPQLTTVSQVVSFFFFSIQWQYLALKRVTFSNVCFPVIDECIYTSTQSYRNLRIWKILKLVAVSSSSRRVHSEWISSLPKHRVRPMSSFSLSFSLQKWVCICSMCFNTRSVCVVQVFTDLSAVGVRKRDRDASLNRGSLCVCWSSVSCWEAACASLLSS